MSSVIPNETLAVTMDEAAAVQDATAAHQAAHHMTPGKRHEAGEPTATVDPSFYSLPVDATAEAQVTSGSALPNEGMVDIPGIEFPELMDEDGKPTGALETAGIVAGVIAALVAVAVAAGWL